MSCVFTGQGSVVDAEEIVAIADYASVPIQRLVVGTDKKKVVDLSRGREIASVVVKDNGSLVLCSRGAEAIAGSIAC